MNAWLLDRCVAYAKAHKHPELIDCTIWQAFKAERPRLVQITGPFDGFHATQVVKPGVTAIVRVAEIPGHPFPGQVTRIADALDPGTRTLLTEIDVPNADGELSPGMYSTVELQIPRRTPSLIVPDAAVVFDAQGVYVFVVENGVARQHQVTEIRDLGTEMEVSKGVKAGDPVVVNPPVDLEDGRKVKIRTGDAAR